MRRRFLVLAFLMILPSAVGRAEGRFKVIVHPSVPVTSLSKRELAMVFLKKTTTLEKWGSRLTAMPIDLAHTSATRIAFTKVVHKKEVAAIKSYWQQQIFSGRGSPPPELADEGEVIAAVVRTPGAIGYVSDDTSTPSGVKILTVTE